MKKISKMVIAITISALIILAGVSVIGYRQNNSLKLLSTNAVNAELNESWKGCGKPETHHGSQAILCKYTRSKYTISNFSKFPKGYMPSLHLEINGFIYNSSINVIHKFFIKGKIQHSGNLTYVYAYNNNSFTFSPLVNGFIKDGNRYIFVNIYFEMGIQGTRPCNSTVSHQFYDFILNTFHFYTQNMHNRILTLLKMEIYSIKNNNYFLLHWN